MRAFTRTVAVQLRCVLVPDGRQGGGSRVAMTVAYGLGALLMAVYGALMGVALGVLGATDAVPALGAVIGFVLGVVFSLYKASGALYEAADYGLVMSWPIPVRAQVTARLAALALVAVGATALLVVPMGVAAMAVGPAAGVGAAVIRALSLVACVILAPLPGTVLAALVAAAVSLATARLAHGKAVHTVVLVVLTIALVMVCSVAGHVAPTAEMDAAAVSGAVTGAVDALCTAWPPAALLRAAWGGPIAAALGALGLFCLVDLVVAMAGLEVVARTYRPVMAAFSRARAPRRVARASRPRAVFSALCRKEVAQVLDTTAVVVNDLLGLLLVVVLATVLAVVGVDKAMVAVGVPGRYVGDALPAVAAAMPWLLAFCVSIAPVPAVAVSLEGRCSWIMETLPVPVATVLASKAVPWLVACVAASAASAVLVAVAGLPWPCVALCLVVPPCAFWLSASLGLFLDARNPDFSWTSPAALAKRSMPVTVSVFVAMIVAFGLGALSVVAVAAWGWSESASLALNLALAAVLALLGTALFHAAAQGPMPRPRAER